MFSNLFRFNSNQLYVERIAVGQLKFLQDSLILYTSFLRTFYLQSVINYFATRFDENKRRKMTYKQKMIKKMNLIYNLI